MSLKDELYVTTLARHKSINLAAKELYISPPALSMYIKHLEKDLGIDLFNRENKTFELTHIGKIYVDKALAKLKLDEEFHTELTNYLKQISYEIKVGLYTRRSFYLIPKLLKAFSETHPEVKVDFFDSNSATLDAMLLNEELDYIIASHPYQNPALNYIQVLEDELLLVCPHSHPASKYIRRDQGGSFPSLDSSHLKEETFILTRPNQNMSNYVKQLFEELDFHPKNIVTIGNIEVCIQTAAEGMGLAFTLKSYIPQFHKNYPVTFCRLNAKIYPVELSLIYLKKREPEPFINYLVDFTREFLQAEMPEIF